MTPSGLTDDELLRHYDELFRAHPATAELCERLRSSNAPQIDELELECAKDEAFALEQELSERTTERDRLAEVLEDFLDDTSAANAKAARKVLDGLK